MEEEDDIMTSTFKELDTFALLQGQPVHCVGNQHIVRNQADFTPRLQM